MKECVKSLYCLIRDHSFMTSIRREGGVSNLVDSIVIKQ